MNKNKTPSKNDDMNETSFTHQSDDDSVKRSLSLQYGEDEQIKILKSEKNSLKKKLEEKEETLRKLKMVKLYRNKHNLEKLDELISKWRETAQDASDQLYEKFNDPKPTMSQFLQQIRVEHDLIQFDPETEMFY